MEGTCLSGVMVGSMFSNAVGSRANNRELALPRPRFSTLFLRFPPSDDMMPSDQAKAAPASAKLGTRRTKSWHQEHEAEVQSLHPELCFFGQLGLASSTSRRAFLTSSPLLQLVRPGGEHDAGTGLTTLPDHACSCALCCASASLLIESQHTESQSSIGQCRLNQPA